MLRRFLTMLRKEFLQLLSDKLSLKLLIMLPVAQLLLIGPALDKEVKHIPTAIFDSDQTPTSAALVQRFLQQGRFTVKAQPQSIEELQEGLRTGTTLIAIQIPRGFARELELALDNESTDTARIRIFLDGQDATTAQIAAGYAQSVIQQWLQEFQDLPPPNLFDITFFNPELVSSWYMVPGMAAMLVTMVIALVASFSLVRERENGTLEQLLVTPVGIDQILLGKMLPYWLVGSVEFLFALQLARLFFGIPLVGSIFHLALLVIAYSLSSVALGLAIGTLVRSRQQALFLIYFFMVFFILTSGFLMPVEGMPQWTQQLTLGNATRHFLTGVREIMLRGASLWDLKNEFAWILGIAISLLSIAWWKFDRQGE